MAEEPSHFGPRWHVDCDGFIAGRACRATFHLMSHGDCHASFHKPVVGVSVNFGILRCRSRNGCRRRWRGYGRRRRHRGRQRRWTRWNGDSDAKGQRHYRFNLRDIGFEQNGNVVRQRSAENEYGDDGHACLSERNKEALLTALFGARRRQGVG
jgi:hypothetical protein